MKHLDYMREAIEEAKRGISAKEGGPFGSVIVKDGEIIGRGHNQVVANNDPTCHGEIQAIRNACKTIGNFDLSGCVIYTTGEPCPMCRAACLWANIDKVYYGCTVADNADIGFRDESMYKDLSAENDEFLENVGREDCLALFDKYKKSDKTMY